MKPFFVWILCALSAFGADALKVGDDVQIVNDVRVIGFSRVNLNPVRLWFQRGQQGERPLKAWKRFHVIQLQSNAAGLQYCAAKNEAGEAEIILVSHFPFKIQNYVMAVNKLNADIAATTTRVDAEEKRVREADAVAPIAVRGPLQYVNEQMDFRAEVNLAAAKLTEEKKRLAQMKGDLAEYIRRAEDFTALYVMPTGKKWSGDEIWEHGTQ